MSCNNNCGTKPEDIKKPECCSTKQNSINYITIVVLYILLAIILGSVLFY